MRVEDLNVKMPDTIPLRTLALTILQIAICILQFAICNSSALAQPTLTRLSFHVPPERMKEFEAAYEAKVVPILKTHGLVESSERGRATPDSIFSRLFEVKALSEVADKQAALQVDPLWQTTLRDLGAAFGRPEPDGLIRHSFEAYIVPAGPGRVVSAGPGKVMPAGGGTGHWHVYDVADGLTELVVRSILQDREGYLWFGTYGGACQYDGQRWITFTAQDGLANNGANSILQDREGNLWFGTWNGGVSRYDGKTFTTFTTKDGLADNRVVVIFQDREEYLWFGTYGGGVSRYDPSASSGGVSKAFTTFTTKDGLADNQVVSIFQDREGVLWFGTYGGVSRYDPSASSRGVGKAFTTFTTKDGLANNEIWSILQDREGVLWFGTSNITLLNAHRIR